MSSINGKILHADHVARATLQPFLQAVGEYQRFPGIPLEKLVFVSPLEKEKHPETSRKHHFDGSLSELLRRFVDVALMTSLFYIGCTFN